VSGQVPGTDYNPLAQNTLPGVEMPQDERLEGKVNRSINDLWDLRTRNLEWLGAGRLMPGDHVMGLRLPRWQRPAVWSSLQQAAFIESAWRGLELGTIVITERYSVQLARRAPGQEEPGQQEPGQAHHDPLDNLLIDGQQRLRAIELYLANKLTVIGSTWEEVRWEDKVRFWTQVRLGVVKLDSTYDEARLRELYIRMNYGGTAHAPEHHPDVLEKLGPGRGEE